MARWGKFITFEGIDGSGKSTLAGGIYRRLLESLPKERIILTHEPGGTPFANSLRETLSKNVDREPMAELFTLLASRYDHTKRLIIPALQNGKVVLCDRYSDSTFAYQVFGKGLEYHTVARLNKIATLGIKPKLTLLIDIPVEIALDRLAEKGKLDHYESLDVHFFERVRYGYLALAKRAKRRIKVLDGTQSKEKILDEAWGYVFEVVFPQGSV
ncbi:MAG: dTMP kinase [Thermotogae bacterium]|nr:dTMP kinase [Thermotogota bacterium]